MDVALVTRFKFDVTFFTPGGTPRVFNNPIFIGITGKEDTVIKTGSTVGVDTTGIERPVSSIDSDGYWLFLTG